VETKCTSSSAYLVRIPKRHSYAGENGVVCDIRKSFQKSTIRSDFLCHIDEALMAPIMSSPDETKMAGL